MMEIRKKDLSPRQRDVLNFIQSYLDEYGYPPAIRDITTGCGISSTSVASFHLRKLEQKGYLRRRPDISRGIELASTIDKEEASIPLIGVIAAGMPIPVPSADTWNEIDSGDFIRIPRALLAGAENVYALKVKGDSMQDALISDGDIVIMESASVVENGQTAAVWLKDEKEITLKKVFQENNHVRLQPANKHYKAIVTSINTVEIQGKVIAVLRNL
jgi:repressor LexA